MLIEYSIADPEDRDDITGQLEALRQHIIERHGSCKECRQRLHKLVNSVQVVLFGKKPGFPLQKRH
jgi:hypothetical protein